MTGIGVVVYYKMYWFFAPLFPPDHLLSSQSYLNSPKSQTGLKGLCDLYDMCCPGDAVIYLVIHSG